MRTSSGHDGPAVTGRATASTGRRAIAVLAELQELRDLPAWGSRRRAAGQHQPTTAWTLLPVCTSSATLSAFELPTRRLESQKGATDHGDGSYDPLDRDGDASASLTAAAPVATPLMAARTKTIPGTYPYRQRTQRARRPGELGRNRHPSANNIVVRFPSTELRS